MSSSVYRGDVKLILVAILATLVIYPLMLQASWLISPLEFDDRFLEAGFPLKGWVARETMQSTVSSGILIGVQAGLLLVLGRCLLENLGWLAGLHGLIQCSKWPVGLRICWGVLLAFLFLGLGFVVFVCGFQLLLNPQWGEIAKPVSWSILALLVGLVVVTRRKSAGSQIVESAPGGKWLWTAALPLVLGIMVGPLLLLFVVGPGHWEKKEQLVEDWRRAQAILDSNPDYHRVHFEPDDHNEIALGGTVLTPEIRDRLRREMTKVLGARNPTFFMVKVVWGNGT